MEENGKVFPKSKRSQIRFEYSEWKGVVALDVREWYLNESDEWRPTQKGIRIPLEHAREFVNALHSFVED